MSFILDALKKSEIERQRQSVPGLMDTQLRPKRSRLPVWAMTLGILLGVNLMVLTFVLTRKSAPTMAGPARTAQGSRPAEAVAAAAPPAKPFSPLDTAPQYAPEIPVAPMAESTLNAGATADARADAAARVATPTRTDSTGEPGNAGVRPAHKSDPLLNDSGAETDEVLPTISEISLSGAQALPELHLDVHVYATNPAERFVYINLRKYHEGSKLQEGPTVERIRRDGVVLSYQGVRFLLPRQP